MRELPAVPPVIATPPFSHLPVLHVGSVIEKETVTKLEGINLILVFYLYPYLLYLTFPPSVDSLLHLLTC